jgi:predicted ATP-grasp superfamily ATP-dependent carboligase
MRNPEKAEGKLKILFLDQGRQVLPFLKSCHQKGHEVIIVCNTRLSEGYFSRYASKRLLWPSYIKDRQQFENKLLEYLRNNEVDVTISVGDVSSEILSANKKVITEFTRIINPDYHVFIQAADKLNLMNYCMQKGLPCPRTYYLDASTISRIDSLLSFPVIVKPTRGVGAVGLHKFYEKSELERHAPSLIDQYGDLIIQEFIPPDGGPQYQAEAFLDEKGNMKVCLIVEKPRYFPVSGGTSTANVTIYHPVIRNIAKELLEGLNWKGAADIDLILDPRDGMFKILEINPRVTAGIKIGFAAGIDFADLHLKLAMGEVIPPVEQYKTGVYCRNLFLDLLWYFYSGRQMRRETKPSFYRFFGKDVVYQLFSIDDPMPPMGFFLNMVSKYSKLSSLKAKFHK